MPFTLSIGQTAPGFKLPATDGKTYALPDFAQTPFLVIFFTCNHCPYVAGSEEMLIKIVRSFEPRGLRTVTINSNDAQQYPDDSFEHMQAKAKKMALPYAYLHDEDQSVAKLFDAACTPEVYLFDSAMKLAFHGTINDSPRNPAQAKIDYLSPALEQVLAGKPAQPNFVHPFGCSIKWRM